MDVTITPIIAGHKLFTLDGSQHDDDEDDENHAQTSQPHEQHAIPDAIDYFQRWFTLGLIATNDRRWNIRFPAVGMLFFSGWNRICCNQVQADERIPHFTARITLGIYFQ